MAKITSEEVKKIARLSKLDLAGQEEKFSELLSDTLNYIQVLEELDTTTTKETYQVTGLTNQFQNENKATLSQEDALKNAHNKVKDLFGTDAVFDRE